MRAKQSSTAPERYSCSGTFTQLPPIHAAATSLPSGAVLGVVTPIPTRLLGRPGLRRSQPCPAAGEGKRLLHDARNLMGGIELYCDLLSMPDVLKPEHRSYVEELRLLDTRSEALIEHLTQLLSQEGADGLAENASSKAADMGSSFGAGARIAGVDAVGGLVSPAMPVSLQRPAAASTERMEIGNESGEVSTPDCHSCSVPSRLRAQQDMGGLIGSSPEMEKVYRILSKVAHSTHPVLILGESGTGKEMVARSIHNNGPNAAKPFIPVDCGSLVPTLIESELFGHVKGAFTGANRSKGGLLSAADGGTVFLDEIGELPLDLQAKLLRALQEKEVRPVGATHAVPITARVLAATNRDLSAMVEQGLFRKDLYFRLSVVNLKLPPLRERRNDITVLAAHFLERMHRETGASHVFSEDAVRLMTEYDWPGNVRELENAIECACSLSSGPVLHMADLPTQLQDFRAHCWEANLSSVAEAGDGLEGENTGPEGSIVSIANMEKQAILGTISQLNGDKLMAARLLGIGKTTLYRKLKEYGLAEAGESMEN